MSEHSMPRRSSRLSDEKMLEIVRLDIHRVSHLEIARRVGVPRRTVERTLQRSKSMLSINHNLKAEREQALATYREIQRLAWETLEAMDNPNKHTGILSEIRQAQRAIDALLDLTLGRDDTVHQESKLGEIVGQFIQREAPQLAPALMQLLQDAENVF